MTPSPVRTALLMLIEEARKDPSARWCIVTVDAGKIVNVEGVWEEEIDAVAEAQRHTNDMRRHLEPEEPEWEHFVVPFFDRPEPK